MKLSRAGTWLKRLLNNPASLILIAVVSNCVRLSAEFVVNESCGLWETSAMTSYFFPRGFMSNYPGHVCLEHRQEGTTWSSYVTRPSWSLRALLLNNLISVLSKMRICFFLQNIDRFLYILIFSFVICFQWLGTHFLFVHMLLEHENVPQLFKCHFLCSCLIFYHIILFFYWFFCINFIKSHRKNETANRNRLIARRIR